MTAHPTRIDSLDIIRGIALLFIFIANVKIFSGYVFFDQSVRQSFASFPVDQLLYAAITLFVDAKFYTIFSLLFGIGFYVQMNSFREQPERFPKYMFRRLFLLMLIGLLHMFFIWLGDIIALYALMGMLLVLCRNMADKTLIMTGLLLVVLLPIANAVVMGVVGFYPGKLFQIFSAYVQSLGGPPDPTPGTPLQFIRTEDLTFYLQVKIADPIIRLAILLADGRFFKVLGILMLGLVIGRHIVHKGLLSNKQVIKTTLFWGLIIGLPANTIVLWANDNNSGPMLLLKTVAVAIGTLPLSLAYAAAIVLALNNIRSLFAYFSPVGRMALTNYICQSVVGVFAFSGIGFGLIDKLGLAASIALVLVTFCLQVIFSTWWLTRYKQGPLEYLWRKSIPQKLTAQGVSA